MSGCTDAARPGPTPVARLDGVVVRFGDVVALDGVGLEIEPGSITVLLGPNGAGKTTVVRLCLGLVAPTAGTVRVFGRDPREPAARARVGAMMQVSRVPETLRVREHIETFRSYYPAPLGVDALVEAAGLQGLERRLFGTLSGGEKQRLLFALALAGDPALLFLDEPTVSMDVETRRALWQRIRALRAEGRAVLLTTHDLDEADALADRVVVLDRGRIVADGTPAAIKRSIPVRRIRCSTRLDLAEVRAIPHVHSAEREADRTVLLTAEAESVVRALLDRDAGLYGLEVAGAGLEEAFLALTGRGALDPDAGTGPVAGRAAVPARNVAEAAS